MMTEKLYDFDSGRLVFSSKVISCEVCNKKGLEGFAVELAETCFFPEGGGQPADVGSLGGLPVLHTYEEDGRIFHLCPSALEVGSSLEGRVEEASRFLNMQIHSGEHILSGVIARELGLKNVGFHMGKEASTIDLDGEMTLPQCQEIENRVNLVITSNVPVKTYYPDAATLSSLPLRKKPEVENLRVVEVEGCDFCGCCGTHVSRTGEIGILKLIDAQRYKGGTRLFFLCGCQALEDYQAKHRALRSMAADFSCKTLEVPTAVSRMQADIAQTKSTLAQRNRELFTLLGNELALGAPKFEEFSWLFLATASFSPDEAKAFACSQSSRGGSFCTAFSLEEGSTGYAFSKSPDCKVDIQGLANSVNRSLGGKGGGNATLCCGKIPLPLTLEQVRLAVEAGLKS